MRRAVIFDIDGTICYSFHRNIEELDKVPFDTPDDFLVSILKFLSKKHAIILLTGRSEECRLETEFWLDKQDIPYDELFMKRDKVEDFKFKKSIYEKKIKPHYIVKAVFEDRPSVVDMWNDLGVKCYACADQRNYF